jgi:glycerate 2-kinase
MFRLILSDVIGNELQSIASGPTVPDLTTFERCIEICKRYQIYDRLPGNIRTRFELGVQGKIPETPKPDPRIFDLTTNSIIGSAENSADAAEMELETYKIATKSLKSDDHIQRKEVSRSIYRNWRIYGNDSGKGQRRTESRDVIRGSPISPTTFKPPNS